MSKPVILTGLRANNDLHIGNYLGALSTIVALQKHYAGEFQINLFVPDLHSFTTPIDHENLLQQTMHNLRLFVAAGLDLDNPDTYIYRQSYIPAHSELTIILNSFTYMGELSRMTQFKDKSTDQANVSAGLFDYPVLMAADILLYGAKYVPVGEDQAQHVELARDVAVRLNNKFKSDLFILPTIYGVSNQAKKTEQQVPLRIRDLQDPAKKMSKSDETGKGVLFLGDSPEEAAKKIMSATTDSFDEIGEFDMKKQPGISNLMQLLATLRKIAIEEVVEEYKGSKQYGPLKTAVAEEVRTFLKDFQAKLKAVDDAKLIQKLETSELAMNKVANETLLKVQKAVGLRPKEQ